MNTQPVVDTLTVPGTSSKPRSASLDAPYLLQVPGERVGGANGRPAKEAATSGGKQDVVGDGDGDCDADAPGAAKANRSRSVDISLPTRPGESYKLVVSISGAAEQSIASGPTRGGAVETGADEIRAK